MRNFNYFWVEKYALTEKNEQLFNNIQLLDNCGNHSISTKYFVDNLLIRDNRVNNKYQLFRKTHFI